MIKKTGKGWGLKKKMKNTRRFPVPRESEKDNRKGRDKKKKRG